MRSPFTVKRCDDDRPSLLFFSFSSDVRGLEIFEDQKFFDCV